MILINGEVLNRTKEERDLGVIVTDNFKVGKQCLKASKKANNLAKALAMQPDF